MRATAASYNDLMTRPPSLTAAAVLAVVVPLAFAGCNSSNGSAPPADLSPAAKAKWNEYCAYRTACQETTPCATTACMAAIAEEGPLMEFVDCQIAQPCSMNDDECIAAAGTTDAERQAFTARCVAALSAGPAPTCLLETAICTIVAYPMIRKQYMHAVDACLTVPCEDLAACIDAATEPLNCF